MSLFGFLKKSPSLGTREISELSDKLRIEQELRAQELRTAHKLRDAEKRKTDKIVSDQKQLLAKVQLEQSTRKAYDKRTRAKAGLVNLEQAERYTIMRERAGLSPARKAALDAIIISRREAVKAMGFNIDNMRNPMRELERMVNAH